LSNKKSVKRGGTTIGSVLLKARVDFLRKVVLRGTAVFLLLLVAPSCSNRTPDDTLRIGIPEEPRTLNIWFASDANSRKVLSQIYQPLYIRDPETLEMIPWLAENQPSYDPHTLSYTVKLRPAQWSDGTEVTSEDVAFTAYVIQKFNVPSYISRWRFVRKIETPDRYTVKFYLKKPNAIFLTRTLATSIVQKRQWEGIVESALKRKKPLATLLNQKIEKPIGSGPYVLEEWRRGAYLHLSKNRFFFGKGRIMGGRVLGPFVGHIILKIYGTSDVAILALKKGSIDFLWWGIQPGYIDNLLKDKNIQVFFSKQSAIFFLGFNLRKPPFNAPVLRRAVAMLVDRNFIVSRILQGYGNRMLSMVPEGNKFYYNGQVSRYGFGMTRDERIRAAYAMLSRAGYTWDVPPIDAKGGVVAASGMRLPNGEPMEDFTILTPPSDYDPYRAIVGIMIQEWLREMGMPAFAKPMSFDALLEKVKARHDFDAFVLGYGRVSLDPDYLRIFFDSSGDKPRGWNMSGYRNPVYDALADASRAAMDPGRRQKLIRQMQEILLKDVPYFPLYNPALIEAVRKDRFKGWVEMLGGIGNIWSFCELKETGQSR
jgi:peptide/nickel transport system substrate-binding protein